MIDVNRRKKESLYYLLFMIEAPMKLLYRWEFEIGRIILVILFLELFTLQQRKKGRRRWERDMQTDRAKTGGIFHTHFPDFDGESWCVRIGMIKVLNCHLCVGEFLYWNPFIFFTWEAFPMN